MVHCYHRQYLRHIYLFTLYLSRSLLLPYGTKIKERRF
nr:MAG TPA: hypothetical protein [Caudoviricetes sp.]